MASNKCKLSALFKTTESIGAKYAPTGSVVSTDLFGNPIQKAISTVFETKQNVDSTFSTIVSKKGVFSSELSLSADYSCKTITEVDDETEDCGKLDFTQTCSSAHIVTIGL